MELFFSSEDTYSHLKKNWLEEMYSRDVYLIRRYEYLPITFELKIDFFNPEKPELECSFLFTRVTSFIDIIHDLEVFEESYEYDETEDPMSFSESEKDGIAEYFIHTNVRELWWRTNETPKIETGFEDTLKR